MDNICQICQTDPATERHHIRPKSKGGKDMVNCCSDCGGQFHILFDNITLARNNLTTILETNEMRSYIAWKKKHPGPHKHRMSSTVKQFKKGHR
jgi:hypothetical protein